MLLMRSGRELYKHWRTAIAPEQHVVFPEAMSQEWSYEARQHREGLSDMGHVSMLTHRLHEGSGALD